MKTMRVRLATVGVLLVAISSSGTSAGAIPPPPKMYLVSPNDAEPGTCYIMAGSGNVALGQGVAWSNIDDDQAWTVTQRDGFWTYTIPADDTAGRTMNSAGTFMEKCADGGYTHAVPVVVTAPANPSGQTFTVTWATGAAASTLRYDVRYKIGTGGTYKLWKNDTALKSASFTGIAGKTYYFEARTIKPSTGKMTNYSPGKKVVV